MSTSHRPLLVLSAMGSDAQAEEIARELVESKLAACAQIVGKTCSVYRWEGKVVREEEKQLWIKTREDLWPAVEQKIQELHSYDVPEIIAIPLEHVHGPYLQWLHESLAVPSSK